MQLEDVTVGSNVNCVTSQTWLCYVTNRTNITACWLSQQRAEITVDARTAASVRFWTEKLFTHLFLFRATDSLSFATFALIRRISVSFFNNCELSFFRCDVTPHSLMPNESFFVDVTFNVTSCAAFRSPSVLLRKWKTDGGRWRREAPACSCAPAWQGKNFQHSAWASTEQSAELSK